MAETNVELTATALEAFNRGQPDAVAEIFWAEAMESWSELRLDVIEIEGFGRRTVAAATLHGRSRETSIEVDRPVGFMFEFRDGLITRAVTCPSREDASRIAQAP